VWKRARWHECASELAQVSLQFRRAYWGIRSKGWPRHPDDEREMIETSVQGVQILRSLALAVRSEQDFDLITQEQSIVGALKQKDAIRSDAMTTKQQGGYKSMLNAVGFCPLRLRQALNKIAHADPSNADFYVAPADQAHDLLLFGEDRGSQWFAAVSILELIRVVEK
jgi:hypothetical protein